MISLCNVEAGDLKNRYKIGIGIIVVIIILLYGAIPLPGNSPIVVVSNYYAYLSWGNVKKADSLLTPTLQNVFQKSVPVKTYFMKPLFEQGPYPIRLDQQYQQEVQVIANIFVLSSLGSGLKSQFIYLGRNSPNDPWRIMGIGTGP